MNRFDRYEKALDRLARLLEKRPMTATEIARRTGCSKFTAYKRVEALRERGFAIEEEVARNGSRGPCARRFYIAPPRAKRAAKARS